MNAQYTKKNTEENIRQDGLIAHIVSSIWQLRQDVYAWPQESPGFHPTFKGESQTEERKMTLALCLRYSRWPFHRHYSLKKVSCPASKKPASKKFLTQMQKPQFETNWGAVG